MSTLAIGDRVMVWTRNDVLREYEVAELDARPFHQHDSPLYPGKRFTVTPVAPGDPSRLYVRYDSEWFVWVRCGTPEADAWCTAIVLGGDPT